MARFNVQGARDAGYSDDEILDFIKLAASSKKMTQREADLASMDILDEKLGVVGDIRNLSLAIPRFLFPKPTENLELGLYGATASLLDPESGKRRVEESKAGGVPGAKPMLESAPSIALALLMEPAMQGLRNKVLSPTLQKISGKLPKSIVKSTKSLMSSVGKQIDDLLRTSGQGKNIPVSKFTTLLDDLLEEASRTKNEKLFREIASINDELTQFGDVITPEQSKILARRFSKYINKAGEFIIPESLEKGVGAKIAETGTALSKTAQSEVPGLAGLDKTYGTLANFGKKIAPTQFQPFTGYGQGIMPGFGLANLLQIAGGPRSLMNVLPTATGIAFSPYLRFMAQKGLSNLIGSPLTQGLVQAGGSRVLDYINPFSE